VAGGGGRLAAARAVRALWLRRPSRAVGPLSVRRQRRAATRRCLHNSSSRSNHNFQMGKTHDDLLEGRTRTGWALGVSALVTRRRPRVCSTAAPSRLWVGSRRDGRAFGRWRLF
jgi:hypothetical protein